MTSPRPIDRDELKRWIDERRAFVLLDVLPPEAFRESRLPGAVNACVYEITFLDQVVALCPDRAIPVVVYCTNPGSLASAEAAERLCRAGYADVRRFAGGREAWREGGYPFEGRPYEPAPAEPLRDGEYAVDTERSVVAWVGRNPGGSHDGTLRFRGGRIRVEGSRIGGGFLEVDMRSLEVGDLDGEMAELLKRHLESEDFFAVDRHPVARFEIARLTPIGEATPGAPNFVAEGEMTIRGKASPLAFEASVAPRNGAEISLEAHFDIDRTLWGVNYGSGKLFDRLGMHLVNDHVSLQIRIAARRA